MLRGEMVDEYLKTLNLYGSEPNFELLGEVVRRHVATYPFSSVGCRLGEELPLDFEALYHRIVVRRRGGYCFEQNGLLYEILVELGFSPELYLARVIYNQDSHPGLTHRISIVENKGQRYVVDVGFGPLGPRVPVLLSESESPDGAEYFEFRNEIRASSTCRSSKMEISSHCIGLNLRATVKPIVRWGIITHTDIQMPHS